MMINETRYMQLGYNKNYIPKITTCVYIGSKFYFLKRLSINISIIIMLVYSCRAQNFQNGIRYYKTNSGLEFGVWGGNEERYPAPLLFILANTTDETLGNEYFRQCGNQLARQFGWLCASLDLPSHGKYVSANEKEGLWGWVEAITRKEDFVSKNNRRMQEIIEYLISKGYVDENNIAVCGTSRGGYLALRFVAFEKRIKTAVLFSPVTDFSVLEEFSKVDTNLISDYRIDNFIPSLSNKRLFFAIGDRDKRVGTDRTIDLASKIIRFSNEKHTKGQTDLNVTYEPKGHTTPPITVPRATAWIMQDNSPKPSPIAKWDSTSRSEIYRARVELIRNLPHSMKDVIFLGNSISFWGEWQEMFESLEVKNRGIPGDNTYGVIERLNDIIIGKPSKIFILIGINDLANKIPNNIILSNYERIVRKIKSASPLTKIYFQTILPTNDMLNKKTPIYDNDENIKKINSSLKLLAERNSGLFEVIDLYKSFADENGKMKVQYTWDGVHLNYAGYMKWLHILTQGKYL